MNTNTNRATVLSEVEGGTVTRFIEITELISLPFPFFGYSH
jgi:hypothetical protein